MAVQMILNRLGEVPMSFKTKVLGLSVMGLAVTNVLIIAILLVQKGELHEQTSEEVDRLGRRGMFEDRCQMYTLMLRVAQREPAASSR